MAAYIGRRALSLVPILFFLSLVTFALMHSVEGGPWSYERPLPPHVNEYLNHKYGLDRPVWRQYLSFAWNAAHGDLGVSFVRQNEPVTTLIFRGFRVTAVLGVLALAVALVAGLSLGVLAAVKHNRAPDYAGVLLASVGASVPSFVLGIFLIYVLSVQLHLLPTFGWDTRGSLIPGLIPNWKQAVMPVITLAAFPTAYLARVTRASLLQVLRQDYVRTARAKGLPESVILYRHSLRNALIPIATITGPLTVSIVTGSFIVEQLFSIPGSGRLFVQSITERDYGMIMGTTLFFATLIAVANTLVDIAYTLIDPRIRYSR